MTILTLRTDKPESEIGLFEKEIQKDYLTWQAHRELADTIHTKIEELLSRHNLKLDDVDALVCYKGPGSFTGLRIGLSVANAIAYSINIPVVGVEGEEQWLKRGLNRIWAGENDKIVIPEYGSPVHITQPKS